MFIFRSRRSQLLTRLWTLDNVEAGEQEESRRRITNLLKRLEVGQLERLVAAVETGQCCSLTGEDWLVQLRWPELTSQDGLIRLPTCPTSHCSNPQHWARLATPGTPQGMSYWQGGRRVLWLSRCNGIRYNSDKL